ncbi:MAG: lipid droplet-associated protein [Mycobacterium sp.]|uniref:lipid droplet-associated protein n=1 Tax=uncultured Mycolicibacterium sp. TaxID=2320817 RepID=UPI0032B258BF|nr:lipid droplet-associated protein [Mycobacterium sp.]
MATAPYGVRLLVGAAATAIEETRKLPQTILMYPMTLASQVASLVMKVQQDVAVLVIKGDETLETFFPPKDEQAEWATFDDDLPGGSAEGGDVVDLPVREGARMTEGRYALFSSEPETPSEATTEQPAPADVPEIVAELEYESLTLAQLRARLTSLRIGDLEALLSYEEATKARAPFQTLLANRITRASAK